MNKKIARHYIKTQIFNIDWACQLKRKHTVYSLPSPTLCSIEYTPHPTYPPHHTRHTQPTQPMHSPHSQYIPLATLHFAMNLHSPGHSQQPSPQPHSQRCKKIKIMNQKEKDNKVLNEAEATIKLKLSEKSFFSFAK